MSSQRSTDSVSGTHSSPDPRNTKTNGSDQSSLFTLVESGQLRELKELIDTHNLQKSLPTMRDRLTKRTALHIAVLNGHIPVIKHLLSLDCDPNAVDVHRQSVLHYAAHTGDTDVFDVLKKADVNFNSKDIFGRTALHHGAMQGSVATMEWLVDNALGRADTVMAWINQKDQLGSSALHWAAVKGRHDVVKFLVARGINIHLYAGNKQTAAGLALAAEKDKVHQWLGGYAKHGHALLTYVEKRRSTEKQHNKDDKASRRREGSGAGGAGGAGGGGGGGGGGGNGGGDDGERGSSGEETLEDVRKTLSSHMTSFEKWKTEERSSGSFVQFYRNRHGMTALHIAAKYGDYLVVCELIHTHNFCLSSLDHYGRVALHYAALYGHTKIALLLSHLSKGYREEDTHRHFVNGDYTNGLRKRDDDIHSGKDNDYDTDVRVTHWKIKTVTELLPSQMAEHGKFNSVHHEHSLSKRLAESEEAHQKSLSEYLATADQQLTSEQAKARRQLMGEAEKEEGKDLNEVSGNGGGGGGGGGGGTNERNEDSSGSSGDTKSGDGGASSGRSSSRSSGSKTNGKTSASVDVGGGGGDVGGVGGSDEDGKKLSNKSKEQEGGGGGGGGGGGVGGGGGGDKKKEEEEGRQEVRNWLENAGLAQYADVFLQNGWETTDALVLIQEANLKEMGVKPGHRAVILNHIQERRGVS